MALTSSQLQTVKTAVIANPTAAAALTAGDTVSLLAWLNGASATLAWRALVPAQDSDEAATYTSFDSLVAGKRESWRIFLMFTRDFGKAKVRNWIVDVWGAATASSVAESVLQAGTELATNGQFALGGTSPTTGTVAALRRSFAGLCDQSDANWLVNN